MKIYRSVAVAVALAASSLVALIGAGATTATQAAAATAPVESCVFTGPAIGQLVLAVTPGEEVNVNCKGYPDDHPYLFIEASLLVAIDPAAQPLLTGQVTSVAGVEGVVAALPEMNAASTQLTTSSSTGTINFNYKVPTSQPPDPNATCPPTTEELNSGLIGCAVAMIDPESGGANTTGTFLINYKGQSYFPPNPTLALSTTSAEVGHEVNISDAPGAKTFWWVATLQYMYDSLGGTGGGGGAIPVVIKSAGRKLTTDAAVTPASYSDEVFTPPKLSGWFIAKTRGRHEVNVTLSSTLLGLNVSNTASEKLKVTK
ncbi:MAG: hypothetical protein ABSG81_04285 [Acidimicrobiales bacterium]|jgi:hypothetical protein